ncbi:50S ribosomal protein L24 [Halalkalicoccus jeotgali]|uniref:Large ribosomal subunit protein uL24 n=1 Tax=Halalkalicoccus jeotgali (strain DSM 18796 / CECT 7217 / JCM 14584 / KCTC 4019 / B3) TaxID=795797 RepID=D8J9J6_HALJB|nr:50S ribosomal protein L24 [Halalkalicoccus jeotgali]ADJ14408.1 50S ribosomal protein L24P [Halalkalicoccus jeotgali B3]ELY40669.1 50S ribosomal protein L24P [Halalkalicoccus jeotgali B3]
MSKQPRKQRNDAQNAPLHERHKQLHATLDGDLREEHGTRRTRVNVGDTVQIMRGDFAGETGEVVAVDLKRGVVHVEDAVLEKADGEEVPRPMEASNLRITALDLEDEVREARLTGDTE